jgi:ribosomal protein L14E/L6E/L27E
MLLDINSWVGKIVCSKAGRDKGKFFIILSVLDDKYVYICDGSLRTVEKPKKKKVKHLNFTNSVAEEIRDLLILNKKINSAAVRKILQSYDKNKEV